MEELCITEDDTAPIIINDVMIISTISKSVQISSECYNKLFKFKLTLDTKTFNIIIIDETYIIRLDNINYEHSGNIIYVPSWMKQLISLKTVSIRNYHGKITNINSIIISDTMHEELTNHISNLSPEIASYNSTFIMQSNLKLRSVYSDLIMPIIDTSTLIGENYYETSNDRKAKLISLNGTIIIVNNFMKQSKYIQHKEELTNLITNTTNIIPQNNHIINASLQHSNTTTQIIYEVSHQTFDNMKKDNLNNLDNNGMLIVHQYFKLININAKDILSQKDYTKFNNIYAHNKTIKLVKTLNQFQTTKIIIAFPKVIKIDKIIYFTDSLNDNKLSIYKVRTLPKNDVCVFDTPCIFINTDTKKMRINFTINDNKIILLNNIDTNLIYDNELHKYSNPHPIKKNEHIHINQIVRVDKSIMFSKKVQDILFNTKQIINASICPNYSVKLTDNSESNNLIAKLSSISLNSYIVENKKYLQRYETINNKYTNQFTFTQNATTYDMQSNTYSQSTKQIIESFTQDIKINLVNHATPLKYEIDKDKLISKIKCLILLLNITIQLDIDHLISLLNESITVGTNLMTDSELMMQIIRTATITNNNNLSITNEQINKQINNNK